MKRMISIALTVVMIMSCISFNVTSAAAAGITTVNGFLDVEAERLDFDKSVLEKIRDKRFSGSYGLSVISDDKTAPTPEDPAHLDVSFTADKAGKYYIWMRHTANVGRESGQNMFLSVNNGAYNIAMLAATPEHAYWKMITTVNAAEDNTKISVKIRRRQRDSIVFDRFIITNDSKYVPDDIALGIPGATPKPVYTPVPEDEVATFDAKDGLAVIEAEDTTIVYDVEMIEDKSLSGGKGIVFNSGFGTLPAQEETAQVEFNVNVDKGGAYSVWGYISPYSKDKNLGVSFKGGPYSKITMGDPKSAYEWRNLGTVSGGGSGGKINIRLHYINSYLTIDKFVIVSGIGSRPVGPEGKIEKVETPKLDESLYPKPPFTPPTAHPRIYFTKKDIPKILENAQKPQNKKAWDTYQEDLVKYTGDGTLQPPFDSRLSNMDNLALGAIEAWAFNYATEGNEEYGKKAVAAIQNYMETLVLIDPNNDPYTRNAGHAIFTLSEVYDWCYPLLTDEVKENMINLSVQMIKGGFELGWPPTKQSAVVTHGSEAQILRDLNAFAIAVYNERPDIYNVVVGRFLSEYLTARKYHYTSGMFHQGTGYGAYRGQWDYNSTWIFDAIGQPNIYGDDQHETAYWFLYLRRPDGGMLRDGDYGENGGEVGVYRDSATRNMLFMANYYNDPYLKQNYLRSNLNLNSYSYGHGATSPVEFLCINNPDLEGAAISELPQTRYFGSPEGLMIARTGWNDGLNAPDAVAYMKVKEMWFANHDHLDAGSFQLYYKGILANDTGRYEGYGDDHWRNYSTQSVAHNTIYLYDGENEYGQGTHLPGTQYTTLELLLGSQNNIAKVEGHEFGPDTRTPDYTYLKGDITRAYDPQYMEDYERSFMFLDLKNNTNPAALVVFDRVRTTREEIRKAWLLHGPTAPEVNGNQTIYRNNENGYNGKMTVDTLLPKADNTRIDTIGGAGQEAWAKGVNHPAPAKLLPTRVHESDGYRIEVSAKNNEKQTYFLNVMQVGDSEPDTPALPTTLIETDKRVGAKIADRVVMFAFDKGRTKDDVEFSFDGEGTYQIMVADMEAGTYGVSLNGALLTHAAASEDGGLLTFEGGAGAYKITYSGAEATKTMYTSEAPYDENIKVRVANKYIYSDVAPTIINDRTLIPMRAIFESVDADISWDDATQTVTGVRGPITVKLTINDTVAYVNDKAIELDVPAMLINDRTMVPVRFVAESLNCTVGWDDFSKTVTVSKPAAVIGVMDGDGSVAYPPMHKIENALTIHGIHQNASDGNDIENTLDGDFATRWAVEGTDNWAWGVYGLGSVKTLDKLHLSFHNGDARVAIFSIEVSEDGENYTRIIDKQKTSGATSEFEVYDLKGVKARYVKFLGHGNTVNMWNSPTEIVITEKK